MKNRYLIFFFVDDSEIFISLVPGLNFPLDREILFVPNSEPTESVPYYLKSFCSELILSST